MQSYKLVKRLLPFLLAGLIQVGVLPAMASTMQEAKDQQSALVAQEQRTAQELLALEQDAANRLVYIAQLEEQTVGVQKEIDQLNQRIVLLDQGLAKAKADQKDKIARIHKAKDSLIAQKDELGYSLDNIHALQESVRSFIAQTQTAKDAAALQAQLLAVEREKTDAAIDDWYSRYRAAQVEAGGSMDNLGGDVLQGTGAFSWPMPGFTDLTQHYGGEHRGIDIAGGGIYGKSIVASAKGTVAYAGWMGSYGYVVFIDHGNGYQTRYAHMSALGCAEGDVVDANGVIGYVGSTGNSTGPHLHFEILFGGTVVDPFLYF